MNTYSQKTCKKCHQEKPLDEFYPNHHSSKDGHTGSCRICFNKMTRERHRVKKLNPNAPRRNASGAPYPPVMEGSKPCVRCGVEQPVTEFHPQGSSRDGRRGACRTCLARDRKRYPPAMTGHIICRTCEQEKHVLLFPADNHRKNGRSPQCIECISRERAAAKGTTPKPPQSTPKKKTTTIVPVALQLQRCIWCFSIKTMDKFYKLGRYSSERENRCMECRQAKMRTRMQVKRATGVFQVRESDRRWWEYCARRRKFGLPYLGGPAVTMSGLLELHGGDCFYCLQPLRLDLPREVTLDHVVPVRHPEGRHDYSSVVAACWGCNRDKHTHTLEEWKGEIEAAWLWERISAVQHRVPEVMRFCEIMVPG